MGIADKDGLGEGWVAEQRCTTASEHARFHRGGIREVKMRAKTNFSKAVSGLPVAPHFLKCQHRCAPFLEDPTHHEPFLSLTSIASCGESFEGKQHHIIYTRRSIDETIVKIQPKPFTCGAMRHVFRMKKRAQHPRHATNHHFHNINLLLKKIAIYSGAKRDVIQKGQSNHSGFNSKLVFKTLV